MILPFSLLLPFLTLNTFNGNQAELCIQTYPNLQITCATAYEQRLLLNEQECRDLCLKMLAQTCQVQQNKVMLKIQNFYFP
ncbi:hypothetical protein LOAG_07528 [Loa loa]|uniref:Uncharacterized protein n=1 Tax=Loa loa TaxID=7209 RepID=A0A1S0TX31_LOALO|nr:hypothetical protein LOAG_07528 [Loa loa]EFO20958.1 hypothetical protein LOAG_07528 [Loa loa]